MRVRYILIVAIGVVMCSACDSSRVFEENLEFKNRTWIVSEPITFGFTIADTGKKYNLYYNVRNSVDYPYARLFVEYRLSDSLGTELSKKLTSQYLFDQKTGKPLGQSGIGDLFDHQIPILQDYQFTTPGLYKVRLEQFTRQDTLQGILAVGIRVETADPKK